MVKKKWQCLRRGGKGSITMLVNVLFDAVIPKNGCLVCTVGGTGVLNNVLTQ